MALELRALASGPLESTPLVGHEQSSRLNLLGSCLGKVSKIAGKAAEVMTAAGSAIRRQGPLRIAAAAGVVTLLIGVASELKHMHEHAVPLHTVFDDPTGSVCRSHHSLNPLGLNQSSVLQFVQYAGWQAVNNYCQQFWVPGKTCHLKDDGSTYNMTQDTFFVVYNGNPTDNLLCQNGTVIPAANVSACPPANVYQCQVTVSTCSEVEDITNCVEGVDVQTLATLGVGAGLVATAAVAKGVEQVKNHCQPQVQPQEVSV